MNDDRIAYGKGIGMTRTVAFMVGSGLNGGGPQYSHFMACLIIMSWKDASFSNLSCLAKSSPRTLSFFFFSFCTQSQKKQGSLASNRLREPVPPV